MGSRTRKARVTGSARPSSDKTRKSRSSSLTFRTWPHLRSQLQAAADAEGWSISQEIEHRLDRSFNEESAFQSIVHGERSKTPMLTRLIIDTISTTEASISDHPKQWSEDPETAREVFSVLVHLLAAVLLNGVRRVTLDDDPKQLLAQATKPKKTLREMKAHAVLMGAGLIARRDADATTKRAIKRLLVDIALSIDDSSDGLVAPELLKAVVLEKGTGAADLVQLLASANKLELFDRSIMFDFADPEVGAKFTNLIRRNLDRAERGN
jgi:hypothetical protein